jgi:transposase
MTGFGASPSGSQPSARWLLAVITFTYTIGFIDRQVINLLVVPIKNDFGITDTQVSLLQGLAFMGAYIAMSPIFGRLADTGNRRKILTGAALVWTLFTAAAAFSKGYWHLFLARFGVGAAEAAISPTAWSMVADSFEPRRLPRALSIFMIAPYLGGGLALLFGGVVLKAMEGWDLGAVPLIGDLEPWQLTILIVSLPGLLAVALMMTTREPQRRVAATSEASVPSLLDGPINGESFTAWVEQILIPALEPGSIVVLDNLGSHKGSRVRKLLKAAGIRLFFLPPYSPDLNPIEEMFSKLKRLLRKANKRTVEATWRRIGKLLDRFPPAECANYIRGAGYASI